MDRTAKKTLSSSLRTLRLCPSREADAPRAARPTGARRASTLAGEGARYIRSRSSSCSHSHSNAHTRVCTPRANSTVKRAEESFKGPRHRTAKAAMRRVELSSLVTAFPNYLSLSLSRFLASCLALSVCLFQYLCLSVSLSLSLLLPLASLCSLTVLYASFGTAAMPTRKHH